MKETQRKIEQARINLLQAKADVEKSTASLADAERFHARIKYLFTNDAVPRSELETSEAHYQTALAQLAGSKAQVVKMKEALDFAEANIQSMGVHLPVSTSGEIRRDGSFIAYNNGTVLDTRTNLMWAAKDNGSDINWVNAKSYCENYSGGGYKDWRMPTQNELTGLYDSGKSYKATQLNYNVHLTELIQLSACWPWASEANGSNSAFFDFTDGLRLWYPQSGDFRNRALPVRSAK